MNVSGSGPAAQINLDEFERRLRAAGTQQVNWEDPLVELAKLVDTSPQPAPSSPRTRPSSSAASTSQPGPAAPSPADPVPGAVPEAHPEISDESQSPPFEDFHTPAGLVAAPAQWRSRTWMLAVAGLAVAGVAMIAGVMALKGAVPGLPKQVPFIAAAQGPTKVQPPSDDNVASSSDSEASLLKDSGNPAGVKVVTTEEQPVDLTAASATAPTSPANLGAEAGGSGASIKQTVDTPVVVMTAPAPPAAPSQFPDPKPVRTVSLRPDGTPIPAMTAAANTASPAPLANQAPPASQAPPTKPASKSVSAAAGNAEPSTPKLELPTKLSGKTSARIAVAKTETTASPAEASGEAVRVAAPPRAEKAAKAVKTEVAALEPASSPATQPVQSAASDGWAVQLAAPRTEPEAKSEMARLNAKYATALNGSTIGVHKAVVKGATIYRLRVTGLSKADAAALCARLKGDGGECFIANK